MLYISRIYGEDKYGVVDTDDYVEETVSYKKLMDICLGMGIEIKGVEIDKREPVGREYIGGGVIRSVHVYQNPVYQTSAAGKAAVLYGVVVKTSGIDIVAVQAPEGLRTPEARIRLSSFGKSCSGYLLDNIVPSRGKLIIVLDDKVKIGKKTFVDFPGYHNVFLDVTEVTKAKTLNLLYSSYRVEEVEGRIFDRSERAAFYKAVQILRNGMAEIAPTYTVLDVCSPLDRTCKVLESKFGEIFRKVCSPVVEITDHGVHSSGYWWGIFARKNDIPWYLECYKAGNADWGSALRVLNNFSVIVDMKVTSVDVDAFKLLHNYISLFEPSDEIKEMSMRLAANACELALKYRGA